MFKSEKCYHAEKRLTAQAQKKVGKPMMMMMMRGSWINGPAPCLTLPLTELQLHSHPNSILMALQQAGGETGTCGQPVGSRRIEEEIFTVKLVPMCCSQERLQQTTHLIGVPRVE
jgi:hypothetical protein